MLPSFFLPFWKLTCPTTRSRSRIDEHGDKSLNMWFKWSLLVIFSQSSWTRCWWSCRQTPQETNLCSTSPTSTVFTPSELKASTKGDTRPSLHPSKPPAPNTAAAESALLLLFYANYVCIPCFYFSRVDMKMFSSYRRSVLFLFCNFYTLFLKNPLFSNVFHKELYKDFFIIFFFWNLLQRLAHFLTFYATFSF